MEEIKRDFKGYFIPKSLAFDTRVNSNQKLIFLEIDSLDFGEGCTPDNEYLSKLFKVSETQISNDISKLKKAGYITFLKSDGRSRLLKSNMKILFTDDIPKVQKTKEVKPPKEKKSKYSDSETKIHNSLKTIFMDYYKSMKQNTQKLDYYWQPKDGRDIHKIGCAIKEMMLKKNPEDELKVEDISNLLYVILKFNTNKWLMDNLSVSLLMSKWNETLLSINYKPEKEKGRNYAEILSNLAVEIKAEELKNGTAVS